MTFSNHSKQNGNCYSVIFFLAKTVLFNTDNFLNNFLILINPGVKVLILRKFYCTHLIKDIICMDFLKLTRFISNFRHTLILYSM